MRAFVFAVTASLCAASAAAGEHLDIRVKRSVDPSAPKPKVQQPSNKRAQMLRVLGALTTGKSGSITSVLSAGSVGPSLDVLAARASSGGVIGGTSSGWGRKGFGIATANRALVSLGRVHSTTCDVRTTNQVHVRLRYAVMVCVRTLAKKASTGTTLRARLHIEPDLGGARTRIRTDVVHGAAVDLGACIQRRISRARVYRFRSAAAGQPCELDADVQIR